MNLSSSKPRRNPSELSTPVAWWIFYCAFWTATGWILSALDLLNGVGYSGALGIGVILLVGARRHLPTSVWSPPRRLLHRFRHRFRRIFPLSFLVVAGMAALGGVLYHPGNPDGLTQRIPHLLAWLAEGRWHWMQNVPASFNSHAAGFEWLMAPMFVFLKTDRFVFVYNVISYLLMPGLVFSVLHRLGVRKRAAWHWMWLAPAGLCFAMQAGSIGNDMAGAVLALAALHFALRAKESGRCSDVWLSILAAALLSGMKTSNLPLGLPWLVAVWPSLRLMKSRVIPSVAVGVLALVVSVAPIMALNRAHDSGWFGNYGGPGPDPYPGPSIAFIGTFLNLALGNFMPPVFPIAGWWNEHAYRILPGALLARLEKGFEPGAAHLALHEIQFEISAGLGMGLSLLLVFSWFWAWRRPRPNARARPARDWHLALVRWTPWISALVFMARINVSGPGRLMTPYYCLLLPLLLAHPAQSLLVRRTGWRAGGIAAFLLAAGMLAINPPRALWPAKTLLDPLAKAHPGSGALKRGAMLYRAYADRWDALAPIRNHLPPEAKNVGFMVFMSGSTMEASLWRPFGSRRIWRVPSTVDLAELRRKGIEYVVIGTDSFTEKKTPGFSNWLESWAAAVGGRLVAREDVTVLATSEPVPWYLVKIPPAPPR